MSDQADCDQQEKYSKHNFDSHKCLTVLLIYEVVICFSLIAIKYQFMLHMSIIF